MAEEKLVGKITHYYGKLGVAIIELSDSLSVGQTVHIKGAHDDFTQQVTQLQVDYKDVQTAEKGASVGVKIDQKVHENDQVFMVS